MPKAVLYFIINRYKKLHDPKEWIKIDEASGSITLSKILDREAVAPQYDLYNITVLAIDKGKKKVLIWYFMKELESKSILFLSRILLL